MIFRYFVSGLITIALAIPLGVACVQAYGAWGLLAALPASFSWGYFIADVSIRCGWIHRAEG